MKQLNVNLEDLTIALNTSYYELEHYLDLETGDVLLVSDAITVEDEPRLALIESEFGERFIGIPYQGSHAAYQDMEEFIETVADSRLQDKLWRAIQGKGAFRRFKDVLFDYPDERSRWFAFSDRQEKQRAIEWLESIGVEYVGKQPLEPIPLLFLHGFLSSAQGTKAQFLANKLQAFPDTPFYAVDFNPTPQDFKYMSVTGQINRLRQIILNQQWERVGLIGSSLGGQVALNYAHRYGGVERLLLLAPALHYSAGQVLADELAAWEDNGFRQLWHDAFGQEVPLHFNYHQDRLTYAEPPPPPAPTVIIHGLNDTVVPISGSRSYAATYPELVTLIEVESDHRLADQLEAIWDKVQNWLA